MTVFKKVDPNDISITPFNVHKQYTINAGNYSGSGCGFGIEILGANYYSGSFGDPINGIPISAEKKNINGTYKSIIYDSINHLYYSRTDKPSENFGGNLPEREERFLQEKAHVISIPSPIYDLRIKPESIRFTDHYLESLPLSFERSEDTLYGTLTTPPPLAGHWRLESSQSKFVDSSPFAQNLSRARMATNLAVRVVTGSNVSINGTGSLRFDVTNTTTDTRGVVHNVGNGLLVRDANDFQGITNGDWWSSVNTTAQNAGTNDEHGMPAYTVTMWVKPVDWNKMPGNVTGAPGISTLLTRDKNSYFELNMLTSSYTASAENPKGLVPLQMFFGATGSNCTTAVVEDAISEGFGLATGSWNLVSVQQEFWPGDAYLGTSGSRYEELPPWGYSPAKTTLRIYRPDPVESTGYTYIKKIGYATASRALPHWTNQSFTAVTSSIEYYRHMYIGASGSVPKGDANNDANSQTLKNAFTGSMDDIRFFESTLSDAQISNLYLHPEWNLARTIPTTASFDLYDDGYGNIIDKKIITSSFASESKLVGYYGFNEQYKVLNQLSGSPDLPLHKGFGPTVIRDYSQYKNHAISDKVKFIPGISVTMQSGSNRTAQSINYYQSNVGSGVAARFNNSGSIRIPHHSKLNLTNPDGFAISFWVRLPGNQIPSTGSILGTESIITQAQSAPGHLVKAITGSTAGRDYVTLISKTGLGTRKIQNSANGDFFYVETNDDMSNQYPYHIELKNTHYEQDGQYKEPLLSTNAPTNVKINTIVVRRAAKKGSVILESKTALQPYIDNHIVVQRTPDRLKIFINGVLDNEIDDRLPCTDNISDVFIGDTGKSWATGSDTGNRQPYPQTPFSGSIDEVRFYDEPLNTNQILSLYDNNFKTSTAYQTAVVGNAFYEHGIIALTNTQYPRYFSGSLHEGTATVNNDSEAIFSNNFVLKLKNTRELFEQKIKCHTKASDFNLTFNPTARSTNIVGECNDIMSVREPAEFTKDPAFTPYVTTVGLYDEHARLLAVAKLARPIPKLNNVDMTFIVKFDR